MHREISITEFKAKCLAYLREVEEKGSQLSITKHGKKVAEVNPVKKDYPPKNPLKGSILKQTDIMSPIDVDWEVLEE